MEERKEIRDRLKNNNLTFVWLIARLNERGINTDKTEMSSVISGVRNGAKAALIIDTAHNVLDDYERLFAHQV